MQPREIQMRRSLDALRTPADEAVPPAEGEAAGVVGDTAPPDGLVEELVGAPAVRPEALARARERMSHGVEPSSAAVASILVGRMVCDRLR